MARPPDEARQLGRFVQANSGRLLVGVSLALLALCAALKSAKLDSQLNSWIHRTNRIDTELAAVQSAIGEGAGSNSVLLLQAPANKNEANVLSVEALMVHLESLAIANHITVDLFDVNWSLKDICFAPTPPDYEGLHVGLMLDNLMPCATKTPLDCFWEGSKLLGPEQAVNLGSWGPKLKWTSLDPLLMVKAKQQAFPHASFPYEALIDWMHRVGISDGYQKKPCLDPTDPNCPETAQNKISGEQPDIGAQLTGGCQGVATKQMHWKEDEIVGQIVRNKSGHIVSAGALQSVIQLMGEQDMYEYWRKTSKVQDVMSWSVDKAKLIIETWQRRLKEELSLFAHKSPIKHSYKINAMTPTSMLEPIDAHSMLDLTNLKLCFISMTIYLIFALQRFNTHPIDSTLVQEEEEREVTHSVSRMKLIFLATLIAAYIGLILIGSLGVSSFLNLPFNMATIQIMPPIAFYYGFKQALTILDVYKRHLHHNRPDFTSSKCMNELLPAIMMESIFFIVPFLIATIIPVEATRMFAMQVLTYIVLATTTTVLLVPSLLNTTLKYHCQTRKTHPAINQSRLTNKKQRSSKGSDLSENTVIDDLKNVKADSPKPTILDFSARINSDGCLRTNIHMMHPICDNNPFTNSLPDLIAEAMPQGAPPSYYSTSSSDDKTTSASELKGEGNDNIIIANECTLVDKCLDWSSSNRIAQVVVCLIKLALIIAILSQAKNVRYGLQLQDIVIRDTQEYESFEMQERFFPVYNTFIITKGNIEYPSHQRLLHELYTRIERVNGVIKGEETNQPKFWLVYFRDWLLELQDKFDTARNNSMISREGWTQEASDAAKLAYKLLAQTGRPENPIDKSLVESNRLVDSAGLINARPFYYYLTAWIMSDAFSYSNSEANLRPEPKSWNDNPDDLKIERAKPIMYAQIPFSLKLPAVGDSIRVISEIRSICSAFEKLNISPLFPTGVPFIFWDQFINLDVTFLSITIFTIVSLYIVVGLALSDFKAAAIVVLPVIFTMSELYGIMGYLSIPFNHVLAVLLIGAIGFMTSQSIHFVLIPFSQTAECSLREKVAGSIRSRFPAIISDTILLFICATVFYLSRLDFIIRYSSLLLSLIALNLLNSLLIVPTIIILSGIDLNKPRELFHEEGSICEKRKRNLYHRSNRDCKKRKHNRVQSRISLSTISEESECHAHDLKLDLTIRCY